MQISTAYGQQQEGNVTLPRNKYVEIRPEKPTTKEQATRPEFKMCRYTTDAIVADGIDKGEIRKVCTQLDCPIHHPKKQTSADDLKWKAEEQKRRREEAIANTTGVRTLTAIAEAIPVRLMKRDLLFIVERMASLLDVNRLAVIARQCGIRKAKESDSIEKLFAAYLRRSDEGELGSLLVQITIVLSASRQNGTQVLRDAATLYKVDVNAIGLKVRQEFAAKDKAHTTKKPVVKLQLKTVKKAKAA